MGVIKCMHVKESPIYTTEGKETQSKINAKRKKNKIMRNALTYIGISIFMALFTTVTWPWALSSLYIIPLFIIVFGSLVVGYQYFVIASYRYSYYLTDIRIFRDRMEIPPLGYIHLGEVMIIYFKDMEKVYWNVDSEYMVALFKQKRTENSDIIRPQYIGKDHISDEKVFKNTLRTLVKLDETEHVNIREIYIKCKKEAKARGVKLVKPPQQRIIRDISLTASADTEEGVQKINEYVSKEECCPSCRYEFTASFTFERSAKTIETTCPRCHTVITKKVTKSILRKSVEL